MVKTILSGHQGYETAYVVNDYPYGFRSRCSIRYWLEHNKKGTRFVSQTSNPKTGAWNKPKPSTYARFGGAMYLNEENHVCWSGVSEYSDLKELVAWNSQFGATLPSEQSKLLNWWIDKKTQFELAKVAGAVKAVTTVVKTDLDGTQTVEKNTETLTSDYTLEDLKAMRKPDERATGEKK